MNFTSKQIWLINYPVMMSVLVEQLINITDAIFLGHVGETELGASAIAGMYYLSLYILGFGFSLGLQVMIARRNGERRPAETGKVFFQGLFFLTTLAISLVTLSKVFTPFILATSVDFDRDIRGCHTISGLADLRSVFRFPDVGFPGILRGYHQNPCTYRFCHHPSEHERVAKLPVDFRCRKNSWLRNIGCSMASTISDSEGYSYW